LILIKLILISKKTQLRYTMSKTSVS
jgi:hypothetical protein